MKRLIKVQYRRRRENKTDYLARGKLLESKARLVVRKTNRYIIAQIVQSNEAQDKVVCSANSKELLTHGWPQSYSIKNLSAAYLTGYLCAVRSLKQGIKKAVLDSGLIRSTKGNKIYATVKGAIDAGLEIPCSKEVLPEENRMKIDANIKSKLK